jgi:nucleoside-diphosphate-sugar epimerase
MHYSVGEDIVIMANILVTGGSGFIGTNLLESLLERGETNLVNLDTVEPQVSSHNPFWRVCDLVNSEAVLEAFREFNPEVVVHLGGRTDMFGNTLDDYAANHVGTANIVRAIQQIPSVKRVVFTSSQFVVSPGSLPETDLEFRPHTIYGQSKVESEKVVRAAELSCVWTIIRPTNIWGRWHPRYPTEFWRVLKQGRYIHPGGESVRRCYGYVGTVVEQIQKILISDPGLVDRTVFYVGDEPIDLFDWTNAFSLELTGRPVRVVPRAALRSIALMGDVVNTLGGKFPLFSSRYKSMTENYITPMEKTLDRLGMPTTSLQQGVKITADWLRSTDTFWR